MVDLAVIIVNYNVCALLKRCLETVFGSTGDFTMTVCVVDNNSPDDSVAMVREQFPDVVVIANEDNPGYATANNQGMRRLGVLHLLDKKSPRYTLLLNPDTEVMPTTFDDALAYMDAADNHNVGVLGPKLLLPNGELDLACRRSFPSPEISFYRMLGLSRLFPKSERFGRYNLTYLDIDTLTEVDSVVGAFMWVRTAAIQQAGLLDEQFWMYGEDLDWAKRIKNYGWKVVYNPNILALHVKRASSKQNSKATIEFYRAMLIFYTKHYRQTTPFWLHGLILCGIGLKGGRPLWNDIRMGFKLHTPTVERKQAKAS